MMQGDACFREASLKELLNPDFISEYTDFATAEEMFSHADFPARGGKDIEQVSRERLDRFVQEHSEFSSWDELVANAKYYHLSTQLPDLPY
ncbi:MAG: hypothetical protein H0Z38_09585 [Firmicutes bacterium]|nr:hypothetical protein [Bacillota bacterium]